MTDMLAWMALLLGGAVCGLNFYLSFCQFPLYRLRGGAPELYRHRSGFPIAGSLLVGLSAFGLYDVPWMLAGASILIAIDTGGIHWFAAVLIYEALRHKRAD